MNAPLERCALLGDKCFPHEIAKWHVHPPLSTHDSPAFGLANGGVSTPLLG